MNLCCFSVIKLHLSFLIRQMMNCMISTKTTNTCTSFIRLKKRRNYFWRFILPTLVFFNNKSTDCLVWISLYNFIKLLLTIILQSSQKLIYNVYCHCIEKMQSTEAMPKVIFSSILVGLNNDYSMHIKIQD